VAEDEIFLVVEAPFGSHLYRQALALREAILRVPLGLTHTEDELSDDAMRQHFCAVALGAVVGTVSLRPLDEATLQLKQMAVAEMRQREGVGMRLLRHAEAWAEEGGYRLMVIHARAGAEGFYARFDYAAEGDPFEETTLPHVRMTKRLGGRVAR
jgi:predicted N-acetyltransferase YhbS